MKAEEARVAAVLEQDRSGAISGTRGVAVGGVCAVRLLRDHGTTDYIYATCDGPGGGTSGPMVLKGTTIQLPREGGDNYPASIDALFPADIAKALKADADRYKP
ncbi:MAG: hypothetical protein WCD35_13235 [Mycobacteriales bacterium]